METESQWTIKEAVEIVSQITPNLDRHGFLCGIYGSVLRGTGRDLDLLVIPKRINTSIEFAMDEVKYLLDAECSKPYNGIMGIRAFILKMRSGKLIDIQFYLPSGPTGAEEMFCLPLGEPEFVAANGGTGTDRGDGRLQAASLVPRSQISSASDLAKEAAREIAKLQHMGIERGLELREHKIEQMIQSAISRAVEEAERQRGEYKEAAYRLENTIRLLRTEGTTPGSAERTEP